MSSINIIAAAQPSILATAGKSTAPRTVFTSAEPIMNELIALFDKRKFVELASLAHAMTVWFPQHPFGWKALGVAFKQRGLNIEAILPMKKATILSPNDAEAHNNLGTVLMELGRLYDAAASFRRALAIDPYYTSSTISMGQLLMSQGQIEVAQGLYQQALKILPDDLKLRYNMALTNKVTEGDANFAALVDIAEVERGIKTSKSDVDMIFLHFALGKCYDDIGNYEKAFSHFREGGKLKRDTLSYSADQLTQQLSEIRHTLDQAAIDRLRGSGNPSCLPIFILGMPRSGTTLVEQIISSHPDVYGAGELTDLFEIVEQNNSGSPAHIALLNNLRSLDQPTLATWGAEYVARLKQRKPNARRITDKMPSNFLVAGLIHLMLPNAKIIHVHRNPVDTCLSCFTHLFAKSALEYNYDLTELGRYYADYSRMMEHWRDVLPTGVFFDVRYEDIVADQEAQIRRIIEYCGLEWNDACLEFNKNKRWVRTASMLQVRKPIYKSSIARWRRYEKFLDPLLDALGDLAPRC